MASRSNMHISTPVSQPYVVHDEMHTGNPELSQHQDLLGFEGPISFEGGRLTCCLWRTDRFAVVSQVPGSTAQVQVPGSTAVLGGWYWEDGTGRMVLGGWHWEDGTGRMRPQHDSTTGIWKDDST